MRPAATKWWYWWIWSQIPCTTETKMEEEIHPGPRRDLSGHPYYIHYWAKAREGRHYPVMRIIRKIEQLIPGTLRQILSPFWLLLDSAEPLAFWRTSVRDYVDARLAALIGDAAKDHQRTALLLETRNQYEGADRLLLIAGAYLESEHRKASAFARHCINTMVSELLVYEPRSIAADHTKTIFDHCHSTLWTSCDAREHLEGFDFNIARQLNFMLMQLQKRSTEWCRVSQSVPQTILAPSAMWRGFVCPENLVALGVEATVLGYRLHVADSRDGISEMFGLSNWQSLHFEWLPALKSGYLHRRHTPPNLPALCLIRPKPDCNGSTTTRPLATGATHPHLDSGASAASHFRSQDLGRQDRITRGPYHRSLQLLLNEDRIQGIRAVPVRTGRGQAY